MHTIYFENTETADEVQYYWIDNPEKDGADGWLQSEEMVHSEKEAWDWVNREWKPGYITNVVMLP